MRRPTLSWLALALVCVIPGSCNSGGRTPDKTVLLDVGASEIPSFKNELSAFASTHALDFQDHSRENAANRKAMGVPETFQENSITYDPDLTVAASASASDSEFLILAANAGQPAGVVALSFVYDASDRDERNLVDLGISSFSDKWGILPEK